MNRGNKHSRQLKGQRMFSPLGSMETMPVLRRPWWRRAKKANKNEGGSTPFYGIWDAVARFAAEIRTSDFMAEMIRRRDACGSQGVMGALDCATLYALTRWLRPAGGFVVGGVFGGAFGPFFEIPVGVKGPKSQTVK